jgi:hypothetical protein
LKLSLMNRPSAFLPVAMSLVALALVSSEVLFGAPHATDEGSMAHLWQLLMVGQLPVVGYFALRWLPKSPKEALPVMAFQFAAAFAAFAPVYWFRL